MSKREIADDEFPEAVDSPETSLCEKIKLVLVLMQVPIMVFFYTLQYLFLHGLHRKQSYFSHILFRIRKFVWSKINNRQLRHIIPLRPMRIQLDSLLYRRHSKGLNNYNGILHAPGASVRWFHEVPNRTTSDPVILFLHGGGYFLKLIPDQVFWLKHAIQKLSAHRLSVVALDYTVTPYGRYPVQLDQAVAAYTQLSKTCDKIIILGDSAGGNLAAGLLGRLYPPQNSIIPPFGVVFVSPWVDLRPRSTGSYKLYQSVDYLVLSPDPGESYAGQHFEDPLANPIVGSAQFWQKRLPKRSLIVWGEHELLADSIEEWAQGLAADKFVEPFGVHDVLCIGIKTPATTYILNVLNEWLES